MLPPIQYQQQSENHPPQVGEMRYAIGRPPDAGEKLDDPVNDHEPFGLDGEKEIQEDRHVRETHPESQQDAVNGPRSSHGDYLVDIMLGGKWRQSLSH